MPVQRFIHTEFLFERLAYVQTFFREKKPSCVIECVCVQTIHELIRFTILQKNYEYIPAV